MLGEITFNNVRFYVTRKIISLPFPSNDKCFELSELLYLRVRFFDCLSLYSIDQQNSFERFIFHHSSYIYSDYHLTVLNAFRDQFGHGLLKLEILLNCCQVRYRLSGTLFCNSHQKICKSTHMKKTSADISHHHGK